VIVMLMSRRREIMGKFILEPWLLVLGWMATAVMALAALVMFVTWGK
jgi:Mn2+/Fe2+ NRAMP family transporter